MGKRSILGVAGAVMLSTWACGGADEVTGASPPTTPSDAGVAIVDGSSPSDGGACELPQAAKNTAKPLTTTKKTCAAGSGALAVNVVVPPTVEKGKELAIAWSATGLPAGASVGFFLERAEGAASGLPGATGPLHVGTEPACGTTEATTAWDGHSLGCAPSDSPDLCAGAVEPGRYRVNVVVYEEAGVPLVGGPRPGKVGTVLANASSAPFEITGAYATGYLRARFLAASTQKVRTFLDAMAFAGTKLDRYVASRCGSFTGPDAAGPEGRYCETYDLLPPLTGALTTCGTVMQSSAIDVTGTPAYAGGVLPYGDARKNAQSVALAPYAGKTEHGDTGGLAPPGGGTYLSTGVSNWSYRADGGYWALLIEALEAGGTKPSSERFADKVLVRVANDGKACTVKTVKYDEPLGIDLFSDPIACP